MPKPICVKCRLFYRMKKSGVSIIEGMPITGLTPEFAWADYKLWAADLWECKGCGDQIVTGFGSQPIAEHYQPNFKEQKERYAPLFRVNDC